MNTQPVPAHTGTAENIGLTAIQMVKSGTDLGTAGLWLHRKRANEWPTFARAVTWLKAECEKL